MERRPTAAFVLTLLAGLWMLGTGGMMFGMGSGLVGGRSWMWGHGMMHGMMGTAGFGTWFPWFGALAGVILLVGSIFLYTRPEQSRTWGLVILVAAAANFFVGMGGVFASTLGVLGGALALSWDPKPQR